MSSSTSRFLVDSHIHLFRDEHLPSLSWMTPENPLNGQHSVSEYLVSTTSHGARVSRKPLGFVFVETDRICHLDDDSGWTGPLEEFEFVYKVGMGKDPRYQDSAKKVLGIVPWAPLPRGRAAMGRYKDALREIAGGGARVPLLKGFRYLLQSQPPGVMVERSFIESLRWMGEEGLVFELTVDCRSNGLWQLEEAVELLGRAHEGVPADKKLKLIVDHLAKPDLRIAPKDLTTSPSFDTWKTHLQSIASFPGTYIKLSGAFSELLPALLEQQGKDREEWLAAILEYVQPWVSAAIDIFGTKRAIWGSDWPVCTINGGKETAWGLWVEVVDRILEARQLGELERDNIWWGNALRAYQIETGDWLSSGLVGSHI